MLQRGVGCYVYKCKVAEELQTAALGPVYAWKDWKTGTPEEFAREDAKKKTQKARKRKAKRAKSQVQKRKRDATEDESASGEEEESESEEGAESECASEQRLPPLAEVPVLGAALNLRSRSSDSPVSNSLLLIV